ncbi:MAG: copper resistance protein CopC [Hyphomicrobiales bacterium]|nr:copper resistance protein CopC [Hyphomicrobiales bacterium]
MSVPTGARGLFLALVAWALGVGLALAHSALQRAEPPVESSLKRPPSEVKLYFTGRLEPAYSTVRVRDEQGAEVDRQDTRVDPSNPLLLRATLQPLDRGAYTVIWRVLSVDGNVTEGRYTFRVE